MGQISPKTAINLANAAANGSNGALLQILLALINGQVYATYAGNPNGNLMPTEIGQWALDTTNSVFYRATGVTNTSWVTVGVNAGAPVALATATTLSAALHANRTLLLTGTGSSLVQKLPAATGTGNRYRFIVGAVNTSNHVINVTTDDVMYGNIFTNSTGDTPDLAQPWPTAADSDTVTLNGTTTGGQAIGDWIEFIDIAADKWAVLGHTTTSGTEATPFSAAVT